MSIHYISNKSIDTLKKEITDEIGKKITKDWIKTSWNENELLVRIEKGSSSEFAISLIADEGEVNIKESRRKIALLHKPFSGEVEKAIDSILKNVGAKKV
ncbi:MAG: hypothetical protein K2X39_10125 [Silvanigrellaceae bacterium]|nr:hypothetical protein [Silvanigrellaceae bacterium]